MGDSYPRLSARTQRFTLGEPRNIVVSPDGQRVVFVRSRAGDDPVNCLWVLDVATGEERLVADPVALLGRRRRGRPARRGAGPPRARPRGRRRRRRVRHRRRGASRPPSRSAGGCSSPAWCRPWPASSPVDGPVFDPRPDPTARRVAYVSGPALRIAELDGWSWELAGPTPEDDDPDVQLGLGRVRRGRGDGPQPRVLVVARRRVGRRARVDTSPVQRWWIADPANPATPRPSSPTRRPAPTTPSSRCTSSASTGRRRGRVGPPALPLPRRRALADRRIAARHRAVTRSATPAGARPPIPSTGTTDVRPPGRRRPLGRARRRVAGVLADGQLVTCGGARRRRRLLVDGMSGHPRRPPGPGRRRRRRTTTSCSSPTRSTSRPSARVAVDASGGSSG